MKGSPRTIDAERVKTLVAYDQWHPDQKCLPVPLAESGQFCSHPCSICVRSVADSDPVSILGAGLELGQDRFSLVVIQDGSNASGSYLVIGLAIERTAGLAFADPAPLLEEERNPWPGIGRGSQ